MRVFCAITLIPFNPDWQAASEKVGVIKIIRDILCISLKAAVFLRKRGLREQGKIRVSIWGFVYMNKKPRSSGGVFRIKFRHVNS